MSCKCNCKVLGDKHFSSTKNEKSSEKTCESVIWISGQHRKNRTAKNSMFVGTINREQNYGCVIQIE